MSEPQGASDDPGVFAVGPFFFAAAPPRAGIA